MINLILFLLGIIAYTFVEYAVHRWLLHGLMKDQHREHHRNPTLHVQTPLIVVAPVAVLVFILAGPALAVGLLVGWYVSGVIHRRLHTTKVNTMWMMRLQKHHIGHHRRASTNFGVTSVVWDKLFGTGS